MQAAIEHPERFVEVARLEKVVRLACNRFDLSRLLDRPFESGFLRHSGVERMDKACLAGIFLQSLVKLQDCAVNVAAFEERRGLTGQALNGPEAILGRQLLQGIQIKLSSLFVAGEIPLQVLQAAN